MLNIVEKDRFIRNGSLDYSKMEDVSRIVDDVKNRGKDAVLEYTKKFDNIDIDNYRLKSDKSDINKHSIFSDKVLESDILIAKENIERFHKTEIEHSKIFTGENYLLGQKIVPMDRVACYVPGGKAFYPSSLLMTVIPAKIAGVKEIIILTPPSKDGSVRKEILEMACLLGVDTVIAAGGAQGIAYAAYGDADFKKVDKIVGPGNMWVTLAKKLVYGVCDIDMLAGPSEILIVADHSANPRNIALDLLSQAEHGEDSIAALITTSDHIIEKVNEYIKKYTDKSPRKDIIMASLKNYSMATVVDTVEEAIKFANEFAPEHLEVIVDRPDSEVISMVNAAGSLFIGNNSSEALGDYIIGSNHVLPTFGAAKFSSPLGVYDFYRRINIISASSDYIKKYGDVAVRLAKYEGLYAHAEAISERLKDIK